ncbi:MAG: hypothetical protein ACI84E_001697 [Planctomycetota bacterium]|jgi:hypothetical protein
MGACGAASAAVAKSNGRNPLGWFVVGALSFGVGLVVLFVLPNLMKQDAAKQLLEEAARSTQDAIDKERAIAYARHPDSLGRAAESGQADGGVAVESPDSQDDSELDSLYQNSNWFHCIDGQCVGPMPFETLHLTWLSESINGQTLIWRKGMDVWLAIDDLDGMDTALDG